MEHTLPVSDWPRQTSTNAAGQKCCTGRGERKTVGVKIKKAAGENGGIKEIRRKKRTVGPEKWEV